MFPRAWGGSLGSRIAIWRQTSWAIGFLLRARSLPEERPRAQVVSSLLLAALKLGDHGFDGLERLFAQTGIEFGDFLRLLDECLVHSLGIF